MKLLLLSLVGCSIGCSSSGYNIKPRAGVSVSSDELVVPTLGSTTLSVGVEVQFVDANDVVIVADYEFPASELSELQFGTLKTGLCWRF